VSQKNVTAITRGSMLEKQQMVEQREGKPGGLQAPCVWWWTSTRQIAAAATWTTHGKQPGMRSRKPACGWMIFRLSIYGCAGWSR
jgi:hypothetical protein